MQSLAQLQQMMLQLLVFGAANTVEKSTEKCFPIDTENMLQSFLN